MKGIASFNKQVIETSFPTLNGVLRAIKYMQVRTISAERVILYSSHTVLIYMLAIL